MKVELLSTTPNAIDLLLFTKDTRMDAGGSLATIAAWPHAKKLEHLAYMRDTIQSSWEFVDYVFRIEGVSRAFTHQLVRTRTASFAQESQRAVDVSGRRALGPDHKLFHEAAAHAFAAYTVMVEDDGVPRQDARAILPTGTPTSIIIKASLRTLHDMALLRLCVRTQGEYQEVFKAMRARVVEVHPWADDFLRVHCAWYGRCAFPRYADCPIAQALPGLQENNLGALAQAAWKRTEHEANPVASGGVTMGELAPSWPRDAEPAGEAQ